MKQNAFKVGGKSDKVTGSVMPEIEPSTFYSPAISADIRSTYPVILDCPDDVMRKVIAVIVQYLVTGDSFKLPNKIYSLDVKQEDINLLLVTVYTMLKQAIRTKVKLSTVQSDLMALKMPKVFVDELSQAIIDYRSVIESTAQIQRIHFAQLERLRWRIDIVISTGTLSRVMRPTILMQMILKDGRIVTFEVAIEQFNQLRYLVAKVLQEMQTLERHPIVKIINEFKRREEEEYNK